MNTVIKTRHVWKSCMTSSVKSKHIPHHEVTVLASVHSVCSWFEPNRSDIISMWRTLRQLEPSCWQVKRKLNAKLRNSIYECDPSRVWAVTFTVWCAELDLDICSGIFLDFICKLCSRLKCHSGHIWLWHTQQKKTKKKRVVECNKSDVRASVLLPAPFPELKYWSIYTEDVFSF